MRKFSRSPAHKTLISYPKCSHSPRTPTYSHVFLCALTNPHVFCALSRSLTYSRALTIPHVSSCPLEPSRILSHYHVLSRTFTYSRAFSRSLTYFHALSQSLTNPTKLTSATCCNRIRCLLTKGIRSTDNLELDDPISARITYLATVRF